MQSNAALLTPRVVGTHPVPVLALIAIGFILTSALPAHATESATTSRGVGIGIAPCATVFGLLPPVKITSCDEYPADGTIKVGLVDRKGRKFLCGIDRGCGASIASHRQPASRPRHLFVGAPNPARPGWKFLPLWGMEERSLLQLLAGAITDSISDEQNDYLLKGASAGGLTDPRDFEFLRLVGGVERRRRMLEAVSDGEVAPAPDAFAYFGLRGALAVQHIELDRSGRLSSIAISDTTGLNLAVSVQGTDARTGVGAWSVDLGGICHDLYVPLGGYEERYLLTVLSAALRASGERGSAGAEQFSTREPQSNGQELEAALRAIQERKNQVLQKDRSS